MKIKLTRLNEVIDDCLYWMQDANYLTVDELHEDSFWMCQFSIEEYVFDCLNQCDSSISDYWYGDDVCRYSKKELIELIMRAFEDSPFFTIIDNE